MQTTLKTIATALGMSKRAVELRANRENWPFHLETVRGGQRKVFKVSALPAAVSAAVQRHTALSERAQTASRVHQHLTPLRRDRQAWLAEDQHRAEQRLQSLMQPLLPSVQHRLDGRYDIINSWERWWSTVRPLSKTQSYVAYAEAFNAGHTDVDAEIVQRFSPLKSRTLQNWVLRYEKRGLVGLIDRRDGRHRKDVNVITQCPLLEKSLISLLLARPHLSIRALTSLLEQAAINEDGEVLFTAPSYWAVYRFVGGWKARHTSLYTASVNPDGWKGRYMSAFGQADEDVTRLNQRWEMDATVADWMLLDEHGQTRRYSISVVVDVYSRRGVMVISPTPKTETHQLALRQAILSWGVPEEVVTDNGQDYVSRAFVETLHSLGIHHRRTHAFSPWEKPHVERLHRTLLHSVLEADSSFIGHDVAQRKALQSRQAFSQRLFSKDSPPITLAMPASVLQQRVNQWLSCVYEQTIHESLQQTPAQRAQHYTGEVRRVGDERALDILLLPYAGKGNYVVTKKGLRLLGAQFIAPELSLWIGKTVSVYATQDWGEVVVYHEGQFVCIARCPERTGIRRQEIAVLARKLQREQVQRQRKAARAVKLNPDTLVSALLQRQAERAPSTVASAASTSTYDTPALKVAGEAARVMAGDAVPIEVPPVLPQGPAGVLKKNQPSQAREGIPETAAQRWQQWQTLDRQQAKGEAIASSRLARFYASYVHTAEYAAFKGRHAVATTTLRQERT